MATKRLRKEYIALQKKPVENIQALPLESNILEWHYVITGTEGTSYEGGYYHGALKFPPEYPMKPPSVLMYTPNGRFKTGQRLCLSMSDFHPETWNPMWSVSSILTGLYSFMLENQPTLGSINTSDAQKRKYAVQSLEANTSNAVFRKLFPELVDLHLKRVAEQQAQQQSPQAHDQDGTGENDTAAADGRAPVGGAHGPFANAVAKDTNVPHEHSLVAYGCVGTVVLAMVVFYGFS